MMPIGKWGTPLLELVIRHFMHYGIRKFVVLVGYRGNQIRRYFKDGSRWDVDIDYSFDNPKIRGTGGALLNAKEKITTDHMIISYTDILTSLNFVKFINNHNANRSIGTLWLDPEWNESLHSVTFDANYNAIHLNSDSKNILVNTGLSILGSEVFEILEKYSENKNSIDLSGEIYKLLAEQEELSGYVSPEWWLDIGSVSRLTSITRSLLVRRMGHLIEEGVI